MCCALSYTVFLVWRGCTLQPLASGPRINDNEIMIKRQGDTGGRTTQVLPREAQVTEQDWRTKNYNLQRVSVIISLPYIR